jgi:hypothetical protein
MDEVARQDVFISHASADKPRYVFPLTDALSRRQVTFWLDDAEIKWGDSVSGKINEGLRTSQYALVCLSEAFLKRPWPEAEMGAVLSLQNARGEKRLLPLILNSKDKVLAQYPLIAGLAYRELDDPDRIASEVAGIAKPKPTAAEELLLVVEGVHTGKLCRLKVPKRASVMWLAKMAQSGLNVDEAFKVGPFSEFHVRWVLVDVAAEQAWLEMPRYRQRGVHALIAGEGEPKVAQSGRQRLVELGVKNDTVFHLYAIEDEDYGPPAAAAPA